ncbi:MAG TPA: low molecular weight protein tyrosine phosphatase family protein [Opitutales bacterium]|jgi:predicted protein tyrosine phosphatase|nr:low molecular weight protein tyrosine phosphatase family protein [Opitutales bacterium]
MAEPIHVLFVCSANQQRSPTAEAVFADWPGIEVASAGVDNRAYVTLTPELLEWANLIFVMEQMHRQKISQKFKPYLKNQRIICLNIPDEYGYMQPELVELLRRRVTHHLPAPPPKT